MKIDNKIKMETRDDMGAKASYPCKVTLFIANYVAKKVKEEHTKSINRAKK